MWYAVFMILTDIEIYSCCIFGQNYTFIEHSKKNIKLWKQLLVALSERNIRFEINSSEGNDKYNDDCYCFLNDYKTTIYVLDNYSICYPLMDGESCDWEIGSFKKLMNFIDNFKDHPARKI